MHINSARVVTTSPLVSTHPSAPRSPLSESIWPALLPLVRQATNPHQHDAAQIIEEGLSLWFSVLLRAPTFAPALLELFPAVPAIVHRERTPAAAKYAARLIEGYAVLGKLPFMQQYGGMVREVLERLVTEGNSLVMVVGAVNTLLQLFPSDAAALLSSTVTHLLFRVLTFHTVDTATMIAHYLSVFARMLLHHPSSFFAVVERATNSETNSTRENLFSVLLDTWIARVHTSQHTHTSATQTNGHTHACAHTFYVVATNPLTRLGHDRRCRWRSGTCRSSTRWRCRR